MSFDLTEWLAVQAAWSRKTFGPGFRWRGILAHIRKELIEVEEHPTDVTEWIDIAILAFDGASRAGHTPAQISAALDAKQQKNLARKWPDWRTASEDQPIEHDRSEEAA